MDIMKTLLIIAAGILYFYVTGRKKREEHTTPPTIQYDFDEEVDLEDDYHHETIPVDVLSENRKSYPKTGDFVNYDLLSREEQSFEKSLESEEDKESYLLDYKIENEVEISSDIESVRMGVIYSEILKRPYN